jgi:ribosomal-protein-alanine N-acetyltransferase
VAFNIEKAPPTYAIEPLSPADIDAVLEIERLSFKSPWSRQVFDEEVTRTFARVDVLRHVPTSAIVAFCNYWLVADEIHLLNVATLPAERRRGHASRLMVHVLETGRKAAFRLMTLEVRRSNRAAQRLYRRFGFHTTGVRPRYYVDDGEDAILMSLDL